jgi:hypothetical protein
MDASPTVVEVDDVVDAVGEVVEVVLDALAASDFVDELQAASTSASRSAAGAAPRTAARRVGKVSSERGEGVTEPPEP